MYYILSFSLIYLWNYLHINYKSKQMIKKLSLSFGSLKKKIY